MDRPRDAVSFTVEGVPIAQPRHRASCRGGFAKFYIPKDHAVHAWKEAIIAAASDAISNAFEGPVKVDLLFAFPARRKTEIGNYRVSKPDLDNLVKAALDALTDAGAWNDDAQVAQLHTAKVQATDPFVQVRIEGVDFHAVATA